MPASLMELEPPALVIRPAQSRENKRQIVQTKPEGRMQPKKHLTWYDILKLAS